MSKMHVHITVTGPRGCGKSRLIQALAKAMEAERYFFTQKHTQETEIVGIPAEIFDAEIDTRPRDARGLLRL